MLDQVEIHNLFELGKDNNIDISEMLNFERLANGADKEWLYNAN